MVEHEFEEIEMEIDDCEEEMLLQLTELQGTEGPASGRVPSGRSIKLPQLNLPTFSGRFGDWCTFYDLFVSSVHDNPQLSKSTNKESAHPLGNGFWRALESRFLVPKNEAPCS